MVPAGVPNRPGRRRRKFFFFASQAVGGGWSEVAGFVTGLDCGSWSRSRGAEGDTSPEVTWLDKPACVWNVCVCVCVCM